MVRGAAGHELPPFGVKTRGTTIEKHTCRDLRRAHGPRGGPLGRDLRVQLPPGTYRVVDWTTWGALDRSVLTRKAIGEDHALGRPFGVTAGQVVVLGKWTADRAGQTFSIDSWRLTQNEAVMAVRSAYPALADAPVACIQCVR